MVGQFWAIQALGAYIGKGFRLHKKQNKQLRVTNIVGGRLNVFTNCVIGGVFYLTINSGNYGSVAGRYCGI